MWLRDGNKGIYEKGTFGNDWNFVRIGTVLGRDGGGVVDVHLFVHEWVLTGVDRFVGLCLRV